MTARTGTAAPGGGQKIGLLALFWLFLRAGLNFGGGLAITGLLMDELVERRRLLTRPQFLSLYGLARILPGGTLTAHAIALGYRFGGLTGSVVALAGVVLPVLVPALALAALYEQLRGSPVLDLVPVTLLPAGVALLFGAVLTLGKEIARPSLELAIAVAGFVGVLAFGAHPGILLMLGGVAGAVFLRGEKGSG
ncbi:MAG TPA: chromate transporter [Chloroflexota bacterium]|nr:chromate transporter [Chloroflexota bacterium]